MPQRKSKIFYLGENPKDEENLGSLHLRKLGRNP